MINLAIIPARGGSKGIPKKNLKKVDGMSLVARAISSCNIKDIHKVIVSTDDIEIKKEALKFGADVPFLRSEMSSNDDASAQDVIKEVINKFENLYKKKISLIIYLEPTSPLRTSNHVKRAMDKMSEGSFKSVVSVCPIERKPENIFVKNQVLKKYIKDPDEFFLKRQQMLHLCRINSAIYIFKRDDFFEMNKLVIDPTGFIEMDLEESINIDTEIDLKLANYFSKKNKLYKL